MDLLVCQTVPSLSVCVREVGQADLERVMVSENLVSCLSSWMLRR